MRELERRARGINGAAAAAVGYEMKGGEKKNEA